MVTFWLWEGEGEKLSSIFDVFILFSKCLNVYEVIYISHYFCHVSKEDLYFLFARKPLSDFLFALSDLKVLKPYS